MIRMRGDAIVPFLALHLLLPAVVRAQPPRFDIDIKELDRQPASVPEKATKAKKRPAKRKTATETTPAKSGTWRQSDREQPGTLKSATGSSAGGAVPQVEQTAQPPAPAVSPGPVVPALPVAAAPAAGFAWVCSVPDTAPGRIVDSFLNALSLSWCRNRILESDHVAVPFSIRVDRYFEYEGGRYVVSIGEGDSYSYALIRMLEGAGYHVLKISGKEDFRAIGEKLLILLGIVPEFGRQLLPGEKELTGFLVQQEGSGGRRVVITREPVEAGRPWVLGPGCAAR